jgi:hypothetical protein
MANRIIPNSVHKYFTYDPSTGVITRVAKCRGQGAIGPVMQVCSSTGYKNMVIEGRRYLQHRVAWFMLHGEQPEVIDHINRDRLDNRMRNLRNVNVQTNSMNTKRNRGVYMVTNVSGQQYWRAIYRRKQIYNGKSILIAWYRRIMAERADHPIALTYDPLQ